jgi:hypothetical protein
MKYIHLYSNFGNDGIKVMPVWCEQKLLMDAVNYGDNSMQQILVKSDIKVPHFTYQITT